MIERLNRMFSVIRTRADDLAKLPPSSRPHPHFHDHGRLGRHSHTHRHDWAGYEHAHSHLDNPPGDHP